MRREGEREGEGEEKGEKEVYQRTVFVKKLDLNTTGAELKGRWRLSWKGWEGGRGRGGGGAGGPDKQVGSL
jgi:hypothetical protein